MTEGFQDTEEHGLPQLGSVAGQPARPIRVHPCSSVFFRVLIFSLASGSGCECLNCRTLVSQRCDRFIPVV
jgi:hypothetical protein